MREQYAFKGAPRREYALIQQAIQAMTVSTVALKKSWAAMKQALVVY